MASKDELTERQRYWLGHVEACERSGQTTKAYAEVHGLSTSMMYSWRKEFTIRGVLPKRSKTRQAKGFDRVAVIGTEAASSAWHIVLPNGVQIGFSGPVDEARLSAVLTAASRL